MLIFEKVLSVFLSIYLIIGYSAAEPDFCGKVEYFKVRTAFKVDQWLGLFGELQIQGSNQKSNESFHVYYNEMGDPSEQPSTQYYYFNAKYWPEMKTLAVNPSTHELNISYAFSTTNIKVFQSQSSTHLAYFSYFPSGNVYAYDIDTNRPVSKDNTLQEPTFKVNDQRLVYDTSIGDDVSKKLTLKVLLFYFPNNTVTILDLLIFERKSKNQKSAVFHALVYTEEEKDGHWYYMRHLMRSEVQQYEDYMYRKFERLYWYFDDKNDYCDKMQNKVSGVVYLHTEQAFTGFADSDDGNTDKDFTVHFIEFYGTDHRLMILHFDASSDMFKIEVKAERVSNINLLNCKQHPDYIQVPPIECADYPNENVDQIGSYDSDDAYEDASGSGEDSTGFAITLWVGIIALTIAIILLFAYFIYLLIKPKIQGIDGNEPKNTVKDTKP